MSTIITQEKAHELLSALAEQVKAAGQRYELVVIGGSALLALNFTSRPTYDIDLVAMRVGDRLVNPDPLPPELLAARDRVSRDFGVPENWLNTGPVSLLDFGLPEGFVDRLVTERYGDALTVHFPSRLDQIHFKLYALADLGPGKHGSDLRALKPAPDELMRAARWVRTHDPSPGFRDMLEQALRYLGVEDADLGA